MSVDILPTEAHGFYVTFEQRPKEDREQTIEQGMPIFKDVDFAIITMPGGGLVVDKEITQKLLNEWKFGDGRKPPSQFALTSYEAWKDGLEAPVDGIDLKNWPGVTPAQLKMCHNAEIRTVEHLAEANADTLRKLGMGSVALKDKAVAYLGDANGNKASEEVAALKVEFEAMQAEIEKKDKQIEDLLEQLTAPKKKRTRRKRNPETGELE